MIWDRLLNLTVPVDAGDISRRLRRALQEAETFVRAMPIGKEGLLFIQDGQPVLPVPANLADYGEHAGSRQGLWPSSSEIGSIMIADALAAEADANDAVFWPGPK